MSYTFIFKALPEALRHPAGMAMIGSFAFHGALFAGAPLLPESSQAINSERLVRLIQLSPAEQNRLPQVSSSSTTPLPPAPPSDLSSLILPPLSELPDFSNQPNLGSLNPPSSGSAPSIKVSPGQALPAGPPISIPKPAKRLDILPPPPNSITPPPPTLDQQLSGLEPTPPINFPPGNNSPLPPGTASPDSEELGTPEILAKSIDKARDISGDQNLAYQSVSIPFTYPEAACQSRAEGLAFVGILVKPNGEQAQEPELLGDSGKEILNDAAVAAVKNHRFGATGQYQAFLPSFSFQYAEEVCSATTTPSPATESPTNPNQPPATESPTNPNQSLAGPQNTPNSPQPTPQKISITSVYPKAACKERLQGSTLVAATIKPNSQQAEKLKLLSSSGHQTLDKAAIEAAEGSKFKSMSQEQNLTLDFQFQYSEAVCPKGTTQPSQPSTKDSGEATPKSSQENPSSSGNSQDSESSSPSGKSSQPASQEPSATEEPASQEPPESSEEPASQEPSATEAPTAP